MHWFNELKKVGIFTLTALILIGSGSFFLVKAEGNGMQRVLVIYSYHEGMPWERRIDDSLRRTLAAKYPGSIDLNVEHTDRVSYPDDEYLQKLIGLYRSKYSDPMMDLVICIDDEATEIVLKYGDELFPGIPTIFVAAKRKDLQRDSLKPNMTSLSWEVDLQGNATLIQKILPETRHLFVISGSSLSDRAIESLARKVLRKYRESFQISYLTDMSEADLLERVARLPEHSVLIYLAFSRDAEGKSYVPREIMSVISEKANAPMFGIVDTYLGHGIVGGSLLSAEEQGRGCAELALLILKGENTVDIYPERTRNLLMFDWRQLRRWSISEDRLPPGSIVKFKELTSWDEHKEKIIVALALILFQALMIFYLLYQSRLRREVEKRYRTVADYTYDWEYWQNPDGSLRYISPSCERISGYSVQDFKENPALLREIIVPEDKKSWDTHKLKAGKRLKPEEVQFRIHRKDGKIRWIEHVCQPVRDPQGVFLGFRASNRDVTARIQAELDAQKHRSEMTHISRIATLGELSASLAHELNQPLTAILSNAQAARRFLTGNTVDPDEVNEILNDIINDDKRAADMIKRLRTLMRKKELEFTSLDLNKVIRGVAELANREAFTKDVPLVLELADGLPQVRGDVIHLEQVILNLVLNGCEAMADLDHQSRELRILTANHDENAVRVSLRDQGTGIDEGHMTNIFEAFYTTKPEGMGMGLSICRSIIEAHGGRLWAENNPDKGATVSFTVQVSRD